MTARMILLILSILLPVCQCFAGEAPGKALDMQDLSGVMKQAGEEAKTMAVPENADSGAGRQAAESLMRQFQTPQFQAEIQAEQMRLQRNVFHDVLADFAPKEKQDLPAGKLSDDERVYLLISSSVELSTLRSYAAMIDRARDPNVVMVLRGFVGGMKQIKPTMEFIGNVLKKDPACHEAVEKCDAYKVAIQIDPLLFERCRVEQVPVVVYARDLSFNGETSEDQTPHRDFTIAGDAGLDWLLEKINREAKSETLAGLIASLRGAPTGSHE